MTEDTRFIKLTHVPYRNSQLYKDDADSCIIRVKDIKLVFRSSLWDNFESIFKTMTIIDLENKKEPVVVLENIDTIYEKLEEVNNKDLY